MVTDAQLQAAIDRAEKFGKWVDMSGTFFDGQIRDVQEFREVVVSPEYDDASDRLACIVQDHDDVPAFARELLRVRKLARKLLDAGTLDDGEREVVEAMVGGEE